MSEKPSILIVSNSNTKPQSIIKLITKLQTINEDPFDKNKIVQSWFIDTKYYTADVDIIGITENYKRTDKFNENVEALIIHMDSNKITGLEDLKLWNRLEEDCDPEVKLLLATYCNNTTKITKTEATEWSLKHGFEFIELYPSDTEDNGEKFGVDRVIESLQAHTWSNLIMKENKDNFLPNKSTQSGIDNYNIDLRNELINDDLTDDFSDLFSKLSLMKENFRSLPINRRKQCAEQMVTAFWKAIGGDEEELNDI